jgi:hypothetical protein
MPEHGGLAPLGEWQSAMPAVLSSAASVAGRAGVPQPLVKPMERQFEQSAAHVARPRRTGRQ